MNWFNNELFKEFLKERTIEYNNVFEQKFSNFEKISKQIISKTNPFLCSCEYKTFATLTQALLDHYFCASKETIFAQKVMEPIVQYVIENRFQKQTVSKGIDFEFIDNDSYHILQLKSSPDWGNASQIAQLENVFGLVKAGVKLKYPTKHVKCINGCMYGNGYYNKGSYDKICGKYFWKYITGKDDFQKIIIDVLFNNDTINKYSEIKNNLHNQLNRYLCLNYCTNDGKIDYQKMLIK